MDDKIFMRCQKCGKDIHIMPAPSDSSKDPDLMISDEMELVCPECFIEIEGKKVTIYKQETYKDRNTGQARDIIGLTFKIKEKPDFYLDVILSKSRAASYEAEFGEDPFEFLKRRGLEILIERIEKGDYKSGTADLSDAIK